MPTEQTEVFRDWIRSLRDPIVRSRILVRVDRLAHGNPGQHRILKAGIAELKIDVGPGYRVYYLQRGDRIVLLSGGIKSGQQVDIEIARRLAQQLFRE